MKIVRVDMDKLKVTYERLPEEWKLIGGRGLIAKIMNKEVPPDAAPLGAKNKLIIAGRIFESFGIVLFASALVAYRFTEIIWWYWILIGVVLIIAGIYYQENSNR